MAGQSKSSIIDHQSPASDSNAGGRGRRSQEGSDHARAMTSEPESPSQFSLASGDPAADKVSSVPLSDRPLVADDQNTVISSPEKTGSRNSADLPYLTDPVRLKLFPLPGMSDHSDSVRLSHFEIHERIGSGGMGAVFRATDLELARDVALKVLHPSSSDDASMVARFRNEARACASLNHDNIARVFFAGAENGLNFIAYEFAPGKTIRDLIIERGRLTVAEAVNYAIQVTLGLNHIAAAGIVHRDIKPSNIILTPSGRVKIVDLGLARRDTTDSIGDITVAGTTLGTFDYIAPEQARDPRSADIRSDIYSLGCTVYHMLTGQPPYPEGTALQKLLDHQGKSAPDPRSMNQEIPLQLAAVMKKMMASKPEQRYQAPALLLYDLMAVANLLDLQSVPAEGIVWKKVDPTLPRHPVGAVWVFASVVAICVTALIIALLPAPHYTNRAETLIGDLGPPVSLDALPGPTDDGAGPPEPAGPEATAADSNAGSAAPGDSSTETVATADAVLPSTDLPKTGSSEGTSSESGNSSTSVAIEPAVQTGPFLLQTEGKTESYRTLQAAVADAKSGDVILLAYNGLPPWLPVQPPVRLAEVRLFIRAAEGFRPTLAIEGGADNSTTSSLISLRNKAWLNIRDIDLVVVPRDDSPADHWSLFRSEGPNRLEVQNSSIDFINPRDRIRCCVSEFVEGSGESPEELTEVKFSDVVCRGNTDVFWVSSQPHQAKIGLENSAFAVGGHLLNNRGSAASMLSADGSVELEMNHVTAVCNSPFVVMQDSDELTGRTVQRGIPVVSIQSDACVLAGGGPQGILIQSMGNQDPEDMRNLLKWQGYTTVYYNIDVFWQIESGGLDYSSSSMDFDNWKRMCSTTPGCEESTPVAIAPPLPIWLRSDLQLFELADQTSQVTRDSFELNLAPESVAAGRQW
ncbi:MAG: protein kinase, partial [Planctomycetaceae bacterium]|nr:protein kinase [Planctomycetaceae bacterium]